jgi:surface polysaccharide O-acyltransferase-like enzyme
MASEARNGGLDYLRLLAAFGIVVFHSGAYGATIGYAGLPYFVLLMCLFGWQYSAPQSLPRLVRDRALRLLVPWMVCCGLYGGLKIVEVATTSATLRSEFAWWMLATGPALHLWFLPFAFLGGIVVYSVSVVWTAALPDHQRLFCAVLFLVLVATPLATPDVTSMSPPLAQWLYALPAVCLGMLIASLLALPSQPKLLTIVYLLAIAGVWLLFPFVGSLQLAIAAALLLLCLSFPLRQTAWSKTAAETSLTVYLVHPLALTGLERGLHMPARTWPIAAAAIILSFAFAVCLVKLRQKARLLLTG